MRNVLIAAMLFGLQAGCATTGGSGGASSPPVTGDAPRSPGDGLSFQLLAGGGDGTVARAVENRAELPSGARFQIRIVAEQPAYVYLWHRGDGAAATTERILPAGGAAAPTLPQSPIVLSGLALDDQPGREHFYAVASRAALDDAQLQAIAADLPIDRTPPPIATTTDRDGGPVYRVKMDESGLARLLFTVLHAK